MTESSQIGAKVVVGESVSQTGNSHDGRGRKDRLTVDMVLDLYAKKGKKTIPEIAEVFGVSIRTAERKHSLISEEMESVALAKYAQLCQEREDELKKAFVKDLVECEEYRRFKTRVDTDTKASTVKCYCQNIYVCAATIANNGVWTHKKDAKLFKRPSMWTLDEIRGVINAAPKGNKFNMAVAIRQIRQDLKLPDINGELLKTKKLKEGIKSHVTSEDYFSQDEMNRILEAAKAFGIKVESLIQYGYHCATRNSGTRNARWRDITWNNPIYKTLKEPYIDESSGHAVLAWKENKVLVSTAQILVQEKTNIVFNKLLTPYLAELLMKLHEANPSSEFIWLNDEGSRITADSLNQILRDVCNRAGVSRSFPIHWHMLRHTFATHSRQRGVPTQLAIRQGGWDNSDTFDKKYVTVSIHELAEAVL
jgi:integrase